MPLVNKSVCQFVQIQFAAAQVSAKHSVEPNLAASEIHRAAVSAFARRNFVLTIAAVLPALPNLVAVEVAFVRSLDRPTVEVAFVRPLVFRLTFPRYKEISEAKDFATFVRIFAINLLQQAME